MGLGGRYGSGSTINVMTMTNGKVLGMVTSQSTIGARDFSVKLDFIAYAPFGVTRLLE